MKLIDISRTRILFGPVITGFSIALLSCSSNVTTKVVERDRPVESHEPFAVLEASESLDVEAKEIADIAIKDDGKTNLCDYQTVVGLASEYARELGANCLHIYSHKLPTKSGSTCHRIRATAYKIPDASIYEKGFNWNANRKLKTKDFKAELEAAAASGGEENQRRNVYAHIDVRYQYGKPRQGGNGFVLIETYFDCQSSYFTNTTDSFQVLENEQMHFDIAELHSRKLCKAFREETATTSQFEQNHGSIYKRVLGEWDAMRKKYDAEIQADPSRHSEWKSLVSRQLSELGDYEYKSIQLAKGS